MTPPSKQNPKLYEYHRLRDAESGNPRRVSSASTVRRVQALARYGWSASDIARDIGMTQQNLSKSLLRETIFRSTREKVRAWYEAHEMQIPKDWTPQRARTKNLALRNGWPPPLDWEDIEAGILAETPPPDEARKYPRTNRLDLSQVDHVWATRDFSVPLSLLERAEFLRRWRLLGHYTDNDLKRLTGWNVSDYSKLISQLTSTNQEKS